MIGVFAAVSIACMEMSVLSPFSLATVPVAGSLATSSVAIAAASAAEQPPELRDDDAAVAPAPPQPANDPDKVSDPEGVLGSLVFASETDDAVVDRVLAYIDAISTLEGGFTQIAPSGAVSTGKFFLRRPGQLRFEYDEPTPLLIVATQGNVYVRDSELETTDFYPIKKTPLRFLLSKKIDFGDAKVVAVDRGVDTAAITFASNEEETEGELSVIVSAPEMSLRQWIVRDPQNGVTIVTLDNVKAGGKLPNRLFRAPDAGGKFINN